MLSLKSSQSIEPIKSDNEMIFQNTIKSNRTRDVSLVSVCGFFSMYSTFRKSLCAYFVNILNYEVKLIISYIIICLYFVF